MCCLKLRQGWQVVVEVGAKLDNGEYEWIAFMTTKINRFGVMMFPKALDGALWNKDKLYRLTFDTPTYYQGCKVRCGVIGWCLW